MVLIQRHKQIQFDGYHRPVSQGYSILVDSYNVFVEFKQYLEREYCARYGGPPSNKI